MKAAKIAKLRTPHAARQADRSTPTIESEKLVASLTSLRKKLGILLVFAVIWCSVVSAFTYFVVGSLVKHQIARWRFACTQGVILSSKVKVSSDSDGHCTCSPRIKYRYALDGKEFIGDRYDFMGGSSSDNSYAERVVRENPVGKAVSVYYDPGDPSQAILSLNAPPGNWFLLLFLQPFFLAGFGLIVACIAMPIAHARLVRFLRSDGSPPWTIPGWGVMEQDFDGLTIRTRRSLFAPFGYFLLAYGLTCFLSIFVVGIGFGGFGDANLDAIRWAFIVAASVGAAAFVGGFVFGGGRSCLVIDGSQKRLMAYSGRKEAAVPLAKITGLRLRKRHYHRGIKVNGSDVRRLLLEAVIDAAEPITLHAFKWQAGNEDETMAIARKTQYELARHIGCPAVKCIDDDAD